MNQIGFNFYGVTCLVESGNDEILRRLSLDFHAFIDSELRKETQFYFKHFDSEPPVQSIPDFPLVYTSKNSRTYEKNGVRFNDYYGKLLSIYDYNRDICTLYSTDIERSHEILYLLIHSRIGKTLDLLGLHRLHAMGVRKNGQDFLFVSDSGVGKSTLLAHLLAGDQSLEFLSDDCPLVDENGCIYSFPIRLGASEEKCLKLLGEETYKLQRAEYGLKHLLSTKEIKNPLAWSRGCKTVLAFGLRRDGECSIKRLSWFGCFRRLFRPMVVGVGLPMILEYWWELGSEDFVRKARIGLKRFWAAVYLSFRAEAVEVTIGNDPDENIRTIRKYLRWN
jgi:hypothetical protein